MRQAGGVTGPDPEPPTGVAAARMVSRREALAAGRSGPVTAVARPVASDLQLLMGTGAVGNGLIGATTNARVNDEQQ